MEKRSGKYFSVSSNISLPITLTLDILKIIKLSALTSQNPNLTILCYIK